MTYYPAASPLDELALLNLGSRPARRFGARSLGDLRAIPWVFAWSQNGHFVPGWYGVGTGLETFLEVRGERGEKLLRRMFNDSRLFRLIIDEVEKTLVKVDLQLAGQYAALVPDAAVRESVFAVVKDEYERTCRAVLRISGGGTLAERFPPLPASVLPPAAHHQRGEPDAGAAPQGVSRRERAAGAGHAAGPAALLQLRRDGTRLDGLRRAVRAALGNSDWERQKSWKVTGGRLR
jgi:hypothetical protein